MSYYSAGREDRITSQRSAFERARLARKERKGSWSSFSQSPALRNSFSDTLSSSVNRFSDVMNQNTSAMDKLQEKEAEDWQKDYEKDEHKDALAYQSKGFKLQEESYKVAKKAQEEAAKRAQGRQRTSGFLGLVSRAASFIPGVGPLISTGIDAAREFVL